MSKNDGGAADELARLRALNAELVEASDGFLADMYEIFAAPDHLLMAADLAKSGSPAIGEDIDGPETVKALRAALAKARGDA